MDPYDAPGCRDPGPMCRGEWSQREEPARAVIVFGRLTPVPAQSERPCRDSDALIGPWCRSGRDDLAFVAGNPRVRSAARIAIT
jgi:hypothetical protein